MIDIYKTDTQLTVVVCLFFGGVYLSVTQLASMFLGRPISVIDNDAANRLRGVGTSLGNIVHITDGQSNRILGIITARDAIDNTHYKSLIDVKESFDLEVLGG